MLTAKVSAQDSDADGLTVETSDTLTGTWTIETLGVNVTITGNQVKYTFPAGDSRKFVRLKVVGP